MERYEFERGTPVNTFSIFPTRKLSFVLDPECVTLLQVMPYNIILRLIYDLKYYAEPKIEIDIFFPDYLANPTTLTLADGLKPFLLRIKDPKNIPSFVPDTEIPKADRDRLLEDNEQSQRTLKLLALADKVQADGIITQSSVLVDTRYPIYQYHRISIMPLDEFSDVVEVFAHGHSIFWSASNFDRMLTVDIFYPITHWKNVHLFKWFNAIQTRITDNELKENLRHVILNRYPFLLYSRDMVRFYQLQNDHYFRRGLLQRFSMPLGYYMTTFHLLLWGLLEQLTLIAKHALSLRIDEKDCGIKNKVFQDELGKHKPGLRKFIESNPIKAWIDVIAAMRHPAAHRTIPIPTPLIVDTEDSKKSDEEILEIIRKEESGIYPLLDKDFMKTLEPLKVWRWRIGKMKVVAPRVSVIKIKNAWHIGDPVISVDHNLERANAVLDAFLVSLCDRS